MSGLHAHGRAHGDERGRLTRGAALASVGVAIALIALKAWASAETLSVAMLGSLADNALDLVASLVTLWAVGLAAQPADAEHRFGHGKAEAIAALLQTVLILGSAAWIAWRAVQQFGRNEVPLRPDIGIGVSLVAIAVTLVLLGWQRHVVRRTGSVAIETDQLHYQSDLLLNLAVVAAFALDVLLGLHGADSSLGLAIAAWLAWNAVRAAGAAVDMLMDREWPEARRQRLLALVRDCPGVEGAHDLRTRSSGVTDFIQFHIWLPPEMTVAAAHDVVDGVEARVGAAFPGSEVLVHVDPRGHYDAPTTPV